MKKLTLLLVILLVTPIISAPIHDAVERGDAESVRSLIELGVDVDKRKGYGSAKTPLHFAASSGQPEMASILLVNGADINAWYNGKSPLSLSCINRNRKVANLLIDLGADLDGYRDPGGSGQHIPRRTPLHYCIHSGSTVIARKLISEGAIGNPRDELGRTPLHYAAKYGYKSITRALIQNGASVNVLDSKGRTPLDIALKEGNQSVARIIANNGGKQSSNL